MPLRLVLVSPRTPGNVGACARLAANFECKDWVIVAPECAWDEWDAKKFATGNAQEYLERIRVVKTVKEAVADCHAAIGFTRRLGSIRKTSHALESLSEMAADGQRLALVFGNEETGLSREELAACTGVCTIPTSAKMGSLNLSHAVAVVLSRIYERDSGPKAKSKPAPLAEFESLMEHWQDFLVDAGMTKGGNPARILRTLKPLFARASLSRQEIRALRGVLSKAQVQLGTRLRGKRILTS